MNQRSQKAQQHTPQPATQPDRMPRARENADLYDRMDAIDFMLLSEPMLEAPIELADRILTAITSGVKPNTEHSLYRGLRLALGLSLAVVFVAPLMILSTLTLLRWVTDPGALMNLLRTLLQQIALLLGGVMQFAASSLQYLAGAVTSVQWVIMLCVIPITLMWMWTLYNAQRSQIVYRIPVQVL
jgi:hypothetical protein